VIQAGALAEGGEVFVLDMGELVAIQDLAEKMIHLHGMEVRSEDSGAAESDRTIEIVYIGLKPGEKLFEELVIGQTISGTRHPKILKANEERMEWSDITGLCRDLAQACEGADYLVVKEMLEEHVLGYVMADGSTDPVLLRESKRSRGMNVTPIRNVED
jgi:FlaA1/EpsC-like NDP-sugar epimerase